jgi:hypothetical protein
VQYLIQIQNPNQTKTQADAMKAGDFRAMNAQNVKPPTPLPTSDASADSSLLQTKGKPGEVCGHENNNCGENIRS